MVKKLTEIEIRKYIVKYPKKNETRRKIDEDRQFSPSMKGKELVNEHRISITQDPNDLN